MDLKKPNAPLCSSVCLCYRYDSRDRSPVRYKSRSPLPARSRSRSPLPARSRSRSPLQACSRSRSPVRAQSGSREHIRARSASQSPKTLAIHRPRERLLGKTPPLPNPSRSSSPPRYGNAPAEPKGGETSVTKYQRERSRSPLAYSSRKIARAYTPPSPQPKARNSYEKKFSASPVRKRTSPPPKAYALSSDKYQSPAWSRSRSRSVDGKYSSRSPVRRVGDRSSSSTSPPRYGRSPVAHDSRPPVTAKRETVSPDNRQRKSLQTQRSPSSPKHNDSPVQRYRRNYTSPKYSTSPDVARRERSPVYRRANSPAVHTHASQRRASPETTRSKVESYRTARMPPDTETGVPWSGASRRSDQNRKRSPVVSSASLARNGRSPPGYSQTASRSDRMRSSAGAGRAESSPVSRDRRSPRRYR